MKKIVLFISFIFITSLCFGQNLMTNGDLETWTDPTTPANWDKAEHVTQDSTNIHGGIYSAKQQAGTYDLMQNVPGIIGGQTYTINYYYLDNDVDAKSRIWSYWTSGTSTLSDNAAELRPGSYSSDDPSWIEYSQTLQAPATADGFRFEVRSYNTNAGGGYIYYDDFSVVSSGPVPPTIITVYAISNDEIDVIYNIDVTSVDPTDFELTGSATITFSSATIDSTNSKLVHLSGASTAMADDNTLDTISDDSKSSYDFYAGITSISYTNTLNPGGLIDDTHTATFQGIVSANDEYNNVWVSDAAGAYNGVLIFDYDFDTEVAVGDEILFVAKRTTYNNLTELENPQLISTLSTGNAPYGPTVIDGSDINDTINVDTNPAESWEGQFVKIENFYVESYTDYEYTCKWSDSKIDYNFLVGDNVDYHFGSVSLEVDSTYLWIVGVVDWDGSNYRINPRDAADYLISEDITPPTLTDVFVTDATTIEVFFNEYVEETSAETITNYTILSKDISVTGAVLDDADATHVTLTVTGMTYGDYLLFAVGVEDLSGNPSYDSHEFTYSSLPEPGDIVINEIMQNPYAVVDTHGEYFELYNATDDEIDINGWTVRDNGSDSFVIDNGGPLTIASHGYIVLGNDGDSMTNGGYTCDYAYSGMYLGNSEDELILEYGRTIIDSVYWDDGVTFPDPTGASMELDPAHQNSVENDDGANWYTAYTPYGDGDSGTPGSANPGPRPPAPVGIIIQIVGNDILLTWSPGATKASYNIYRSGNPYNSFSLLDSTSDTTYTDTDAATTESKYFYYVTEVE